MLLIDFKLYKLYNKNVSKIYIKMEEREINLKIRNKLKNWKIFKKHKKKQLYKKNRYSKNIGCIISTINKI